MAAITKDTLIGDILTLDSTTAPYFLEMGMHCLGCPASRGETLEQACMVHGVSVDELLKKLHDHITNTYPADRGAVRQVLPGGSFPLFMLF